jgi:hypothetical protein
MDAVSVRRDVEYRITDAGPLTMDLYYPPDPPRGARTPAVIVVAGYPDAGFQKFVGCPFKEMAATVSWARLMAASGLVGIAYTNREPAADCLAVLQHVRQHAASLGIDEHRLGVWTSSGNVPLALWILMQEGRALRCAALCYGYALDLEGATGVADAARMFGFANPAAGRSVEDLPPDVPLFVVRAGRDQTPRLNESLDRFLAAAVARNLPVTFVNHATAPHAFDLFHDSEMSREIVRQVLAFLQCHLLGGAAAR